MAVIVHIQSNTYYQCFQKITMKQNSNSFKYEASYTVQMHNVQSLKLT